MMSAGAHIGRVGALAVALGIGAAVFTGPGEAAASPSEPGSNSGGGAASSREGSPARSEAASPPAADPAGSTGGHDNRVSSPTTASGATDDAKEAMKPAQRYNHLGPRTPKRNHPLGVTKATKPSTSDLVTTRDVETDNSGAVDVVTPSATATGLPQATGTDVSDVASAVVAVHTPAALPNAVSSPATSVTAVQPGPIGPIVDFTAYDAPATPLSALAEWTLLAAARRDSVVGPTTLEVASTQLNTPAGVDGTSGHQRAASLAVPTTVVAIPQRAPLEFLQHIPVIGPMLATPFVTFIHKIPILGTMLHPMFGYPVQRGLPVGTPRARDVKVVSFDGTKIYVHFFPASGLATGQTAPTILSGPGLGQAGSTSFLSEKDEFLANDVIGIGTLRNAGYNVVTWDPRGEFNSGGQVEINSPAYEGRDVSAIISWLATQPEVQLDDPATLDPRIGMTGASYGGGIQLVAAAIDSRIDAIVPTIAWHSLNSSLYKNAAFKSSWGTFLTVMLLSANPNPLIFPAVLHGNITGGLTQAQQDLLDQRGPDELVGDIRIPTLLVQGTVDTLFTLEEAHENATTLISNGVTTKVIWYCGGHGACVSSSNDGVLIRQRTLEWLNRYVKGDNWVDTGPQFEWVDQQGTQLSSDTYQVPHGASIVATTSKSARLPLVAFVGNSGPQPRVFARGPIQAVLGLISGAKAVNALNLRVPPVTTTSYVVGAPELTVTYSGTGLGRHVYAQLVDDTTGWVLGNLVTPVPVTLDGQTHTVTVRMEQVAHTLKPGQTVTLQLVASAVPYNTFNSLGVLNVSGMQLTLPTLDSAAVSSAATRISA